MTAGLAWVRRRQRSLARAVLTLFVAAWLQAAIVPCAMAHGDEPRSPAPAGQDVHGGHGGDGHGAAGAAHRDAGQGHPCVYCPPGDEHRAAGDCDGADCAYPHEPQADARAAGILHAALPVALVGSAPLPPAGAGCSDESVAEAIPRIPLSVSYCRFIE